jgi:uncharacterized protein (DUF1800 family)
MSANQDPVRDDGANATLPVMLYGSVRRTASSLDPYVPSTQQPWDRIMVSHLLQRATYLPTWAELSAGLAMQPGDLVDLLLNDAPLPASPGQWVSDIVEKPVTREEEQAYENRNKSLVSSLQNWWADQMAMSGMNATERMVTFWSGHITSEAREVKLAPLLYYQNLMFREYVFGDFKQLMKNTNHNAGMLRYLGGDINDGRNPNENYARELMELFTMGEGHYTEQDIKEAARCLTGWRLDEFTSYDSYFSPLFHDINNKTFMGRTIVGRDSLDGRFEGDEVVDIIFEREEVALFICRKLYLYFVYSDPFAVDGVIVEGLADIFRQNNYAILPVLAALFKSQHFFDAVNRGAMIKSPAVYTAGMSRQFGNKPSASTLADDMEMLEQELMNPPTVQGWDDYRSWISTVTYPRRKAIAERYLTGQMPGGSSAPALNTIAWAKLIDDNDDAEKLLDNILTLLLPVAVSQSRRTEYLNTMLGGAPVYEWDIDAPNAAVRLQALLSAITAAPDFQLH